MENSVEFQFETEMSAYRFLNTVKHIDAGEELDEIVTDAGNAVEDAGEDVKEGVDAEDKDC